MAIQEGLRWLVGFGLLDVILPFVLVFTIMFATLDRIKLFVEKNGEAKRNINAMIAFCIAFMAVVVANVLTWINALVTAFAITAVFMLLILLIAGIAGAKTTNSTLITGLTLFIFILSALAALAAFGIIDGTTLLNAILWPLIGFIALGITAYLIFRKPDTREESPSNPPGPSR